ncbi:hypothetical protein BDN72DRAFT_863974 [Pluteus cervinus]|uniref:Uncharacterized protein n=1 Tax=Pluteus cervinus TaxID=181527 RepID=A0ACD3A504_9AGAR|nr:hypothetical protein BDN72DRAFT_863974 [Pluteus cervinus]
MEVPSKRGTHTRAIRARCVVGYRVAGRDDEPTVREEIVVPPHSDEDTMARRAGEFDGKKHADEYISNSRTPSQQTKTNDRARLYSEWPQLIRIPWPLLQVIFRPIREEPNGRKIYLIEAIVGKLGTKLYRVRWKGWPPCADTVERFHLSPEQEARWTDPKGNFYKRPGPLYYDDEGFPIWERQRIVKWVPETNHCLVQWWGYPPSCNTWEVFTPTTRELKGVVIASPDEVEADEGSEDDEDEGGEDDEDEGGEDDEDEGGEDDEDEGGEDDEDEATRVASRNRGTH